MLRSKPICGASSGLVRSVRAAAALAAVLLAPMPVGAGPEDVAAGERLFRSQCSGCHSVEQGDIRAGPTLHGVIGRPAGTLQGFDYSAAMAAADLQWTPEALDTFLTDPAGTVPGTYMVFWGLEAPQRRQVIAYLLEATR